MQTRTFQAANMTEAMHLVKAEMGPDALIISSRKERRRGILGYFSKPVVSITAALEPVAPRRSFPSFVEESGYDTTRDEFRRSMLEPLARELRELRERVDTLCANKGVQASVSTDNASGVFAAQDAAPLSASSLSRELTSPEMRELKNVLLDSVKAGSCAWTSVDTTGSGHVAEAREDLAEVCGGDTGALGRVSAALYEAGIGEAAVLALGVKAKTQGIQLDVAENFNEKMKELIETTVRCAGSIKLKKTGPKIVALVGPTGVGKTTTIAKLAAQYTVSRKAKIALVTIDTFRVGAVEQLKTYSRIMGVPLEVASNPKELEQAIAAHGDKDLILIDTVGRSPRDQETIENLKKMLSLSSPVEIHLCVAATTRERELKDIVRNFGVLPLSRLLFTKLDESNSFGSIINLQIENKLPLSYFTRGQRVPEDIEPATGRKVADLLLGE
jgi:flagellar biosynthesis protein FlhF